MVPFIKKWNTRKGNVRSRRISYFDIRHSFTEITVPRRKEIPIDGSSLQLWRALQQRSMRSPGGKVDQTKSR